MPAGRLPRFLAIGACAVVVLAVGHRDEIRGRAEAALGRGMPVREAALARGFVLGEDERIDAATVEDFRRAGLSHLLAVSGQNVALLALLAMPLLAALGLPLRSRLVWIVAAIAVYVPLAGGGPSIVRAGVMGALSLLATLAGRRSSRAFALAIAAIVTLAIDPGVGADVGWQLSFAAVLGILAIAAPLRAAIAGRLGSRGIGGALAEGMAVTIAATLATAPLIAFHFGSFSTVALFANLLVLPAVAPAMWLGMLASIGGQVPGFPVAAPNAIAAPLLAYIAAVASWCGRPHWAYLELDLGLSGMLGSYAALLGAVLAAPRLRRAHRLAGLRQRRRAGSGGKTFPLALAAAGVALALVLTGRGATAEVPPGTLRVSVLDVGQGDAILFQPAAAPAVLIDGGPPGDDLVAKLHDAGVDSLGLALASHEQSDHTGGIWGLWGHLPVGRLLYARLGRRLRAAAAAAGAEPERIAAGAVLRSGGLRIEVLWPPAALLGEPLAGTDPNVQALVLLARWRRFSMLLTGDAEAGEVPLDPGPLDVLKVAHHGSEDAGLGTLLDRASPRLALISVGNDNPYGHPAPTTLAELVEHGVQTLRTDRSGTIVLDVDQNSFVVRAGA
jgi:competence protein ComEC